MAVFTLNNNIKHRMNSIASYNTLIIPNILYYLCKIALSNNTEIAKYYQMTISLRRIIKNGGFCILNCDIVLRLMLSRQ